MFTFFLTVLFQGMMVNDSGDNSDQGEEWSSLTRIQELQERNEALQQALNNEQRKISEPAEFQDAGQLKESKVIELSRKTRRLTVALEKEKTRADSLTLKLNESLGREAELADELESIRKGGACDAQQQDPNNNVKSLKDKLTSTMRKLEDERIQQTALKQQVAGLRKIISLEVGGEDTSIESLLLLLGNGSSWRGRQQQILNLQEKVRKLKALVQEMKGTDPAGQQEYDRSKQNLLRIETERRSMYEKQAQELDAS